MQPDIHLNYLAIVAAMVANIVIGFLWYGPLFGKSWMALAGLHKEKLDAAKAKGMGPQYMLATVGSLVMSYVLAHSLVFANAYLNVSGMSAGLQVGFWNWLGFVSPVTLGTGLWEGKPWRLWAINNGYYLVSLLVMGVILAVWP